MDMRGKHCHGSTVDTNQLQVSFGQPLAYGAIEPIRQQEKPKHPFATERSLCGAYIAWFPLGLLGLHHYYTLRPGFGLLYTITLGLFGIGWLFDGFRLQKLVNEANKKIRDPNVTKEVNKVDAYLLCATAGFFGAHHFYLKRYGFGLIYLCTFGLFGFGWIIDLCRMKSLLKDYQERTQRFRLCDAYMLNLFPITGLLGFQHYYLNRRGMGVFYTLTFGVLGLGWLFDFCRIPALVKEARRKQEEGEDRRKRLDDAYLLWLPPFGFVGLHHCYLERTKWQCFYTITMGGFGILWLVDLFRLPCLVWEFNKWVRNCNSAIPQTTFHPGAQYPVPTVTMTVPQGPMPQELLPVAPIPQASFSRDDPPPYQPRELLPPPPQYPGTSNSLHVEEQASETMGSKEDVA